MVRLIVFIAVHLLVVSCNNIEEKDVVAKGITIEFLGTGSCANSPVMEGNLKAALAMKGMEEVYSVIDVKQLPESDYRRGYGTPTVLVSGMDIFGAPRPLPSASAPS